MQISPETKKVYEIFTIQGNQRYIIPIYQRNYSWGNKQIETLIDDIDKEVTGYYIGNILVTTNRNDNIEEIVDGQQRLTTIVLILLAVYELSELHGTEYAKQVGSIQSDIKRQLLINGSIDEPRYRLLDSDDEIFNEFLKVLIGKKPGNFGNRRFGMRYKYIKNSLQEEFPKFQMLENFYKKLLNIELLKISVGNTADAFSIFSALNSKGLPLTLVDLLKNEYLRKAEIEGITSESAFKNWEKLVSNFEKDSEINITNVTQFLLNNYDSFESDERRSITKGQALDLYVKLINKDSNYIYTLIERAECFNFLKGYDTDKEFGIDYKYIKELNYLDPSQSYPLLLFILMERFNLELSDLDLIAIIRYIIIFFVRRNITLRPKASNVRAMFVNLNRDIKKKGLKSKGIVSLVKNELESKSDNDDEVVGSLVKEGIFNKNHSTTRYILIMLEKNNGTYFTKGNRFSLEDYINQDDKSKRSILQWTIEHILPQGKNLPDHWKVIFDETDNKSIEILQEEHAHKLGNLTLSPYNSELGQKSFIDKKSKMENDNPVGLNMPLFLNDSIFTLNETIESKTSWNIRDIERRTLDLANKTIEIFNFKS